MVCERRWGRSWLILRLDLFGICYSAPANEQDADMEEQVDMLPCDISRFRDDGGVLLNGFHP